MLKPWPKNSASPSCRLGSTDSAYSFRCTWSGARIMIRSASADASAGVTTRSPSTSALAAVAQDGDGAPLDDREVGVVVVEDLGGHQAVVPFRLSFMAIKRGG